MRPAIISEIKSGPLFSRVPKQCIAEAGENSRGYYQIQAKVEDRVEQTTGEIAVRFEYSAFGLETAMKVPALEDSSQRWEDPHRKKHEAK